MLEPNGIFFAPRELHEAVHLHHQLEKITRLRPTSLVFKQKSSLKRLLHAFVGMQVQITGEIQDGKELLDMANDLSTLADHAFINLEGMLMQLRTAFPDKLEYTSNRVEDTVDDVTSNREVKLNFMTDEYRLIPLILRGPVTKRGA